MALCRAGVVSLDQIIAAFEEIAPRIETEALPRVVEADFRRKVSGFAAYMQAQRATDDRSR